jgi:hypothetical protein
LNASSRKRVLKSEFSKASSQKQVLESKFSKTSSQKRVLKSEFSKASSRKRVLKRGFLKASSQKLVLKSEFSKARSQKVLKFNKLFFYFQGVSSSVDDNFLGVPGATRHRASRQDSFSSCGSFMTPSQYDASELDESYDISHITSTEDHMIHMMSDPTSKKLGL